ncbi:MAG: glycosyltransferase family 2 protein, partial [Verrucomicrobiae bacterium]|nr:glycosyltransferase family 2 protein [Verrucomicrobiae bacterium]
MESALAQTYRPIEILVVDDGSKDNTPEVMQAYAGNPLVQYIRQENKGLPAARNTGIRAAKGKYIALLDADDVWEPEKLERQVEFYEQHTEAALVATESYEFDFTTPSRFAAPKKPDLGGRAASSAIPFNEYTLRDLMEFSAFRPSSVVMRRDLCEAVGLFDEQFRYVEDLDMWARLTTVGRIYRINAPLLGARNHPAVQSMHFQPHI